MPNIVNAERSLLAMSARKALLTFGEKLSRMMPPCAVIGKFGTGKLVWVS
jgi:hypothetical protein